MILEVFDKEAASENVLRLKLSQDSPGKIILRAVDEKGYPVVQGAILAITDDGLISVYPGVNTEIGLKLEAKNYPVVKKY